MKIRYLLVVVAAMVLHLGVATPALAQGLEPNSDRPGADLRSFALSRPDPRLCQSACRADAECKSFSYRKPQRLGRSPAMCTLKSEEPQRVANKCCISGLKPNPTPQEQRSVKFQMSQEFVRRLVLRSSVTGQHDTLAQYAAKCDAATGITVPAFTCDDGVAPGGQSGGATCDRPNVLNHECDPGSKFQVLPGRTADAVAVAHCRKQGNGPGFFGDIAVIQHNKKNGATCFYQALTGLPGNNIPAPGSASPVWADGAQHWFTPQHTESIGCTACHDNGAFIRSPYLAQLKTPPHALPSVAEGYDNLNTPLTYPGLDFTSNRSWSIATPNAPGDSGASCTACHRIAVNNHERITRARADFGTGLSFANIATAATQTAKNPHGPNSPIWMRPGQVTYNAAAEASASKLRNCARAFRDSNFATPPAGCTVAQLAGPFPPPDPPPNSDPIECRVWEDSGWQSQPSQAIYFSGPNRSCVPDGTAQGSCGRWAGRCRSVRTGADVSIRVFNDGDTLQSSLSDGVYPRTPGQSCIADGSPAGTCRKWFGLMETSDGFEAECYLFDDGLSNWIGPTRAIYFNSAGKVCAPDGTATGACRKWFGNCQVTARQVPRQPAMQPVACRVWRDDGWQSGLSGAVYMPGANRACVPDGTSQGSCGRWFGRCVAQADGSDVSFAVFNDGNAAQTAPTDGVFTAGPNTACIADGTPSGTCRRWFGAAVTPDGRRASCFLFNDGGTDRIGPTEAIFFKGPGQVCMPDGAGGACRKWFGDCQVPLR